VTITTDDDGDYQIGEPAAPGLKAHDGELTPGDERTCARCLKPVGRKEYFENDYYCAGCAEHANDYPWRTTGTVLGYAP